MEGKDKEMDTDAKNNAIHDERLNEKKPVGYGSSMQSDGTGNHTRPVDLEKLKEEQKNNNEGH